MMVKQPLNINDVDLIDNGPNVDQPVSVPTDMSYFLQRIRLAEIARRIVDQYHDDVAVSRSGGPGYHTHVMAMDAKLDQMLHEIPSFFHLDTYEHAPHGHLTDSGAFIQAYLLNSIVYTQRCKLHLGSLSSGSGSSNTNPSHTYARETCLRSARQIIRSEAQLERSGHVFALVRLRLSGILYGVFMAGIVLLVDACINERQDETTGAPGRDEAAEALRIIDSARSYSVTAANLYALLTQVLAKHRDVQQRRQQQAVPPPPPPPPPPSSVQSGQQQFAASSSFGAVPRAAAAPFMNVSAPQNHVQLEPRQDPLVLMASPGQQAQSVARNSLGDPEGGSMIGVMPGGEEVRVQQMFNSQLPPQPYGQLPRSMDEVMDFESFQWDSWFARLESSPFF